MTTAVKTNGNGNGHQSGAVQQQSSEWRISYVPFGEKDSITLTPSIVRKLVAGKTKSGHLPDDIDIQKFLMLCKSRRLNPFVGDAYLVGYDSKDGPVFTLITAHQSLLKRAEMHNEFNGMESGLILDRGGEIVEEQGDFFLDGDMILGGWARVHFHSRKHPMYKRLRLSTFNTGRSRWQADPAGMIVKCAEADALRSAFPTMVGGMYIDEELAKVVPVRDESLPQIQTTEAKVKAISGEAASGIVPVTIPSEVAESIKANQSRPSPEFIPAATNRTATEIIQADIVPMLTEFLGGDSSGIAKTVKDVFGCQYTHLERQPAVVLEAKIPTLKAYLEALPEA